MSAWFNSKFKFAFWIGFSKQLFIFKETKTFFFFFLLIYYFERIREDWPTLLNTMHGFQRDKPFVHRVYANSLKRTPYASIFLTLPKLQVTAGGIKWLISGTLVLAHLPIVKGVCYSNKKASNAVVDWSHNWPDCLN